MLCLSPVSSTHVLHSTHWHWHWHWHTYISNRLTIYRKLCAAYALGYAHHSPTCPALPSCPYDVPTSLAVLIISESEQLQDRFSWHNCCMEWAIRFACYAKESSMLNSATGGGLGRHPGRLNTCKTNEKTGYQKQIHCTRRGKRSLFGSLRSQCRRLRFGVHIRQA